MKYVLSIVLLVCFVFVICYEVQGSRTSQRKIAAHEESAENMEAEKGCPILDTLNYNADKKVANDTLSLQSEEFVIPAVSNPTTGYDWFMEELSQEDSIVVEFVSKTLVKEDRKGAEIMCGAPSNFIYKFKILSKGSATLRFLYKRPWQSKEEPFAEAVYNITIAD